MSRQQAREGSLLDLLIVGAGPAGISCAIQAKRDGLQVQCVSEQATGGLLPAARRLDNLPSLPSIAGYELARRLSEQMQSLGMDLLRQKAISAAWDQSSSSFSLQLHSGRTLQSKTLCMATGTSPMPWDVATGDGLVHRDIRTLPADLKSKKVLVVGGGEAALDSALSAKDRGADTKLLARGSSLHASAALLKEVQTAGIDIHLQTRVLGASVDGQEWAVVTDSGTMRSDELLVCIGREARIELPRDILRHRPELSILQHSRPGLFLAGDVIRGRDRYTATAMGDGQRAAVLAGKYIREARE